LKPGYRPESTKRELSIQKSTIQNYKGLLQESIRNTKDATLKQPKLSFPRKTRMLRTISSRYCAWQKDEDNTSFLG
jgi:hypothetical protein